MNYLFIASLRDSEDYVHAKLIPTVEDPEVYKFTLLKQTNRWDVDIDQINQRISIYETHEPNPTSQPQSFLVTLPHESITNLVIVGYMCLEANLSNILSQDCNITVFGVCQTQLDFGETHPQRGVTCTVATNIIQVYEGVLGVLNFRDTTTVPLIDTSTLTAGMIVGEYTEYNGTEDLELEDVETSRQKHVRENMTVPADPPSRKRTHREEDVCLVGVCEEHVPDAEFHPCGHIVACLECTRSLVKVPRTNFNCLTCRTPIESVTFSDKKFLNQ